MTVFLEKKGLLCSFKQCGFPFFSKKTVKLSGLTPRPPFLKTVKLSGLTPRPHSFAELSYYQARPQKKGCHMRYIETPLPGAYLIELEKREDDRGFFARLFCAKEFQDKGLDKTFVQANNSFSRDKGTLRGLHYQLEPHAETKLVRCIKGSFYDVILDLRPESPTFGKSFGAVLSQDNRTMMYVPKGFAHGFLTLEPDSEVLYFVSTPYSQQCERGVRWNDPRFSIAWPEKPIVISERDSRQLDFDPAHHLKR
jgi:dTDP-4-dehydrorhamnose 3,5-epimerase